MALPVPVCDPHFHVWDHSRFPNANRKSKDIVRDISVYYYYLKQHSDSASGLDLRGLVTVEAIVGQMEGGLVLDFVGETAEIAQQRADFLASGLSVKCGSVAFVQLGQADAAEVIAAHRQTAGPNFVGVQMITNWSDTVSLIQAV